MTALHRRRHDRAVRRRRQCERRGGGTILAGRAVVAALGGRGVGGCGAVGRTRVCDVTRRTGRRRAVGAAKDRYAAATKENTKWAVKDRSLGSTHSVRS